MTKLLLAAILSLTWTGVALAEDSVLRLPTTETRMARPLTDDALLPRRGCGPQADGERPTADGNAHGDVMVGVGTNGYRDVGARLCAPGPRRRSAGHDPPHRRGRLARIPERRRPAGEPPRLACDIPATLFALGANRGL